MKDKFDKQIEIGNPVLWGDQKDPPDYRHIGTVVFIFESSGLLAVKNLFKNIQLIKASSAEVGIGTNYVDDLYEASRSYVDQG